MTEQLADKTCVPCRGGVPPLKGQELEKLLANPGRDLGTPETFREARRISEAMVVSGEFDPI